MVTAGSIGLCGRPRCVAMLVLATFVLASVVRCEDENVSDIVRMLKSQVDGLLERRQEDFRVLEETIRQSVDKSAEVVALKKEMDKLRRDLDHMRLESSGNRQKNDHLTVQWLATAVAELRGEITELAGAVNISADLQARQEVSTGLDLLRGDVASFRRDLEELRAEQQQTVVTLGQLKQDVDASVRNSQGAVGLLTETKAEMSATKEDVNGLVKSLNKLRRELKVIRTWRIHRQASDREPEQHINHINSPKELGHLRHHRLLRQQMSEMEKSGIELEHRQTELDGLLRRIERQVTTLGSSVDLAQRVEKLENGEKNSDRVMFNVSKHVAELDRLRLSLLQLLESVETLETKVGTSVPDLQREISKIEFTMSQTTSTVALIKEDQENQQSIVKALSNSVESLQEKVEVADSRVRSLRPQLSNCTTGNVSHVEQKPHIVPNNVNNSALPEVIQSLHAIQTEYQNLVRQLPFDCGSIRGSNGVYPIAPGEGPPLLAACDSGWTIFQRRIDGSEDFNRKWDDYARGFGTPADEFWLGNEALARLTAGNCSSLRVELTDIYRKRLVAEYDYFHVGSAADGYRISVGGYHGNASDALDYQNQMQFSTVDSDRDISNSHCAANYEGGWWFSHCQHANLNGRYNLGLTWFDGARNEWIAVSVSEMKLGRRSSCENT